METLDELRARIALKRTRIAKIERTAPLEPYPAVECPLCHKIYSKLPFDGHCKDCEDKITAERQAIFRSNNKDKEHNYFLRKIKKRKIKKVEEWQDRY